MELKLLSCLLCYSSTLLSWLELDCTLLESWEGESQFGYDEEAKHGDLRQLTYISHFFLSSSLCYVGATAKDNQFLFLGGPLLAGITVVALSSLAPMVLPRTAFRALAVTESLSLYGGLAVFGGFILYDTSKILAHAKMVQAGHLRYDPLRESIGLELDFINIFIRLVTILGMRDQKRR